MAGAGPGGGGDEKHVYRMRCVVTRFDVSSAPAFASACLSWSECARTGWYRAIARNLLGNSPTHLPRANRIQLVEGFELPACGDYVDAICWCGPIGTGRAYESLCEISYKGKLICKAECVRVFVKFTEEQKEAMRQFCSPKQSQIKLAPVDLGAVGPSVNKIMCPPSSNDVDGLNHVNMAWYPLFTANAYPDNMPCLTRLKRFDTDYVLEVGRRNSVEIEMFEGKEASNVFILYTRDVESGKLLNRSRFEFSSSQHSSTSPATNTVPLLTNGKEFPIFTRYESTCVSSRFGLHLLECTDLFLLRFRGSSLANFATESGLVLDVTMFSRPITADVVMARPIKVTTGDDSAFEFSLFNMDDNLPVANIKTSDQLQTPSIDLTHRGDFLVPFRAQYKNFNGKSTKLTYLIGLLHDARESVLLGKDGEGAEMPHFSQRVMATQGDSWMEKFSIQFGPSLSKLAEWSKDEPMTVRVYRDDLSKSNRFQFVVAGQTCACITTSDIKDKKSPLVSFHPFAMGRPSYYNKTRAVEGVFEPSPTHL